MAVRSHAHLLAAISTLALGACTFTPESPGATAPQASFNASVNHLRPGQVTVLTVQLTQTSAADDVIGIGNTNVRLRAAIGDTNAVFASGVTDANGTYVGSWSFTGDISNSNDAVSGKLLADIQLNGTDAVLTLDQNVDVSVYSSTPGFAIRTIFQNGEAFTAGDTGSFIIAAQDAAANANQGFVPEFNYIGVVSLSVTNSPNTVLPARVTFTSADQGTVTVSNIMFTHAGNVTFTATDIASPGVYGNATFVVNPNVAVSLQATLNSNTVTGNESTIVNVVGVDSFGNPTTYPGSVTVTATNNSPASTSTPQSGVGNNCPVTGCNVPVIVGGNGNYTITVTGTNSDGTTTPGTPIGVTAVAPAVTHFVLNVASSDGSATIGRQQQFTVAAVDQAGVAVAGYTGTISFSSSDPAATFAPSVYTFPADTDGTATFYQGVTFHTWTGAIGQQSIVVSSDANIRSTFDVTVKPSAPFFTLTDASDTVTEYQPVGVTVLLNDQNGAAMSFTDAMNFTISGVPGTSLLNVTAPAGTVGEFQVSAAATFTATGNATITVSDATNPNAILPATGPSITVAPYNGPAKMQVFASSAPQNANAGASFTFTLAVVDNANNLYPYAGVVTFTSSDTKGTPSVSVPSYVTFSASQGGLAQVTVTLGTPGTQTLTLNASDLPNSVLQIPVTVSLGPADHMVLSAFPASVKAGAMQSSVLTIYDAANNIASGFNGTVTFSASGNATLPQPYTFGGSDAGVHSFTNGFAFYAASAGAFVTVISPAVATSSYRTSPVQVAPGDAKSLQLVLTATNPLVAGQGANVGVTAYDTYSNVATGYTGSVTFTSNNPNVLLPAASALSNGTASANVTFQRAMNSNIKVSDGTLSATSASVTVVPAAVVTFAMAASPNATTAGVGVNISLYAYDTYQNLATNYTGTVTFSTNDAQATFSTSSPYTFTPSNAGAYTFVATPRSSGNRTFAATDTVSGVSGSTRVKVSSGSAYQLVFNPNVPATLPSCAAQTFTVNVLDAYGNLSSSASNVTFTLNGNSLVFSLSAGTASATSVFRSVGGPYTVTAATSFSSAYATFSTSAASPNVVIDSVTQESNTSCQLVTYTVFNACNATFTPTQFTAANSTPEPMTLGPNLDGTTGLTNFNYNGGSTQTFLWDSGRDLPNYNGNTTIRLTLGNVSASQAITLNNGYALQNGNMLSVVSGAVVDTGDLNHSRLTDIAVGYSNVITMLLDGALSPLPYINTDYGNDQVTAVTIGSFTNDGNTQVIACIHNAAQNSNRLRGYVLSHNTVLPTMTLSNVDCHFPMKSIDTDRDGYLDLVTSNASGQLFFLHNTSASGTFGFNPNSAFSYGVASQPNSIVVDDLDLNGTPDLLVTPSNGSGYAFVLYNAGGVFNAPLSISGVPPSIATSDFNRDGKRDLFAYAGGSANLYLGVANPNTNATPFVSTAITFPINSGVAAPVDVDGDGHDDVVSYGSNGTVGVNVWTSANFLASTPTAATSPSTSGTPLALLTGAFSKAGNKDLVVMTSTGSDDVIQFIANSRLQRCAGAASGASTTAPDWLSAPRVASLTSAQGTATAVADVDLDGRPDFLSLGLHSMYWASNDGTGTVGSAFNANTVVGSTPTSGTAVVDVDNDGIPETLYLASDGNTVSVKALHLNTSSAPVTLASFASSAKALQLLPVAAQQPNQALPDLIITTNDNALTVFTNKSMPGQFSFTFATAQTAPVAFSRAAATPPGHDFNNDGLTDLVLGGNGNSLTVVFGSTSHALTFATLANAGGNVVDVLATPIVSAASPNSAIVAALGSGQVGLYTVPAALGPNFAASFTLPNCSPKNIAVATLPSGANAVATLCDAVPRVVITPLDGNGLATGTGYDIPAMFVSGDANTRMYFSDVNGDGAPDIEIVGGNPTASGTYVTTALYHARLAPTYWQGADNTNVIFSPASNPCALTLYDVNHDGYLDGITAQGGVGKVFVGKGADTWDANTVNETSWGSSVTGPIIYADFARNGNGIYAYANAGVITVGSASVQSITTSFSSIGALYPVDLNGDGWLDLVALSPNQGFAWWLNGQRASQPFAGSPNGLRTGSVTAVAFGDFVHQGGQQLVALGAGSTAGAIYALSSSAAVQVGNVPALAAAANVLLAADFDQNGWVDLAVTAGGLLYYLQNVSGTFNIPSNMPLLPTTPLAGGQAQAVDVDHDTYPDLVTRTTTVGGVLPISVVFTGPQIFNGTTPTQGLYLFGPGAANFAAGDINDDGIVDITATTYGSGGVTRTLWTAFGE